MLRCVEEYAALGAHRTAGPADDATIDWMAAAMASHGIPAERRPAPFAGWTGSSELTLDGEPVEHLLVPNGWVGTVATTDIVVGEFDPRSGGLPAVLDEAVAVHETDGRPLVLATTHPNGELVGVNRHDLGVRWKQPVVLCPGRDIDRLRTGSLSLEATGFLHDSVGTNLIGRNDVTGPPLVLATPLNGWFQCAGERGTGVAVLLELIDRLADLPLLVLATTGHELGYFGVRALVARLRGLDLSGIFHVGASVAVLDGEPASPDRGLASTRVAFTSLEGDLAEPIVDALRPANLMTATAPERWLGEATVLSELDVPLLSVTGAGVDFHTPADTPERVTSAEALATVADAFEAAARALYATTSVTTSAVT